MCVIELGGTVGKSNVQERWFTENFIHFVISCGSFIYPLFSLSGDIESMPFIEALRQLSFSVGELCCLLY